MFSSTLFICVVSFMVRLHHFFTMGAAAFWFSLIGFLIVFGAMYVLGLQGMTRRLQHIDNPDWNAGLLVAVAGVAVMIVGVFCQIMQLVVSIPNRDQLRDHSGDPGDGRSLEWYTLSPPPCSRSRKWV